MNIFARLHDLSIQCEQREQELQVELQRAEIEERQKLNHLKKWICDELNKLKDKDDLPNETIPNLDYMIEHIEKIEDIYELYFLSFIRNSISNWYEEDSQKLIPEILELLRLIKYKTHIHEEYLKYFSKAVNDYYTHISKKIREFGELNDIYKNHKTYEIYKKAENKYRIAYFLYLFLALIGVCYGLNWSMDLIKSKSKWITEYGIDIYDFWAIKITAIFIVITGVTFCLKQAIHYQKKKDKAEQTRLELEALPTYMFNFSDEQKNEIYKELTGKYFGRDFDNEGYQGISDVIQEQIKLSNEVLKSVITKNQEK